MDVASEVYSHFDKPLMNVDAMKQFGECPQEGGKQGTVSMDETKLTSKDDEAFREEDGGREEMLPPLNDGCTPMIEAP